MPQFSVSAKMFQAAIFLSLSQKQNSWAKLTALYLLLKALRGVTMGWPVITEKPSLLLA